MEKQHFFEQLHISLAEKHGLMVNQVSTIRSFLGQDRKTRKGIAEWAALKLIQPRRKRSHSKAYYKFLLEFITTCSPTVWEDLTQRTEFDTKKARG